MHSSNQNRTGVSTYMYGSQNEDNDVREDILTLAYIITFAFLLTERVETE